MSTSVGFLVLELEFQLCSDLDNIVHHLRLYHSRIPAVKVRKVGNASNSSCRESLKYLPKEN